jgi:Dna[CI] antecedent, DciA
MKRRESEVSDLGSVLNVLASRLKKVDIGVIDEIRQLWPTIVDPLLAERCRPEFVKSGVLLVSVPSGAFAQRILLESESILKGLEVLSGRAPTSVRTVLQ